MREEKLTILEIGVLHGSSLKTWEEYFTNAKIIGADIMPSSRIYEGWRIVIEIMDQSNVEDLVRVALKHGPFDIIIDDGSHQWEHQKTSLRTLFPFLRDGGIYVVEDLHTNYGSLSTGFRGIASESCADYLKRWVDLTLAGDQIDLSTIEDSFLRTYGRSAQHITFFRYLCLIKKKERNKILVRGDESDIAIYIYGHYAYIGDVDFGQSYLNIIPEKPLQGICITSKNRDVFEYRTKSSDNVWSPWVGPGNFSGSRGGEKNIIGFSIRLKDKYSETYKIKTYFKCFGSDDIFESDGHCESQDGSALSGVQISILRR